MQPTFHLILPEDLMFSLDTLNKSLSEKCPNMEFLLVRIQSECGKIRTRKNSVFRHISRSEYTCKLYVRFNEVYY